MNPFLTASDPVSILKALKKEAALRPLRTIEEALSAGPLTTTELCAATNELANSLQRKLRAARNAGRVVCLREKCGARPAVWSLPQKEI